MDTSTSQASPVCRLIDWTPPRWALLVLLCLALAIRAQFLLSHREALQEDWDGYGTIARTIDHRTPFALGPVAPPTTLPTAARPPLYPILILPAYAFSDRFGGDGDMMVGLLHAAYGMLTIWGVWRLGRLWQLPPGVCLMAAALVTIDPILLSHSVLIMTETPAALLAVATLIALAHFGSSTSAGWALVAGLSMGLCILCRPEFLAWALAVGVAFPWRATSARRTVRLALYAAAIVAVLAPWGIRNYRIFGRPVVTTTHGGFTLLLANNPDFYQFLRSAPWGSVWDGKAIYRQWEAKKAESVRQTPYGEIPDEVALDRWAYREALKNMRAEPATFAYACLLRVGRLWSVLPHAISPDESPSRRGMRFAVAIFYTFQFALAAIGAWFLRRKLFAAPWVFGTLLVLSITAVHAFYWSDMRMRAPLLGVVALAAASGMALLACRKLFASAWNQAA